MKNNVLHDKGIEEKYERKHFIHSKIDVILLTAMLCYDVEFLGTVL